jgi:DNA repair exonuclease SbcCD ATPase subunit
MIDDESLPSIPDVPSPYSPPPSSLFSGESFPEKSTRKKGGDWFGGDGRRLSLQDLSLNTNHRLLQSQQRLYRNSNLTSPIEDEQQNPFNATSKGNQKQLLPVLQTLTVDHRLLQEENRALSAECDKFQRELMKFQQAAQHAVALEETLKRQVSQLTEELQSARESLKESQSVLEAAEQDKRACTEKINELTVLCEANKKVSTDLESALADLESARESVRKLEDERTALEEDWKAKECTLGDRVRDLESELNQTKAKLAQTSNRTHDERKELQSALADATERENKWFIEREALQKEITRLSRARKPMTPIALNATETSRQDLQLEVDRLKAELQQAKQACDRLRSDLATHKSETEGRSSSTVEPSVFKFDHVGIDDKARIEDLIADRLSCIREAKDRATLTKEFHRECARLKAEHEAEIQSLVARHNTDIQEMLKERTSEATARVTSRARETRHRLQEEHKAKVAKLEQHYQNEILRVSYDFAVA